MQAPLCAWTDEAIKRQREQHLIPASAPAAGRQALAPEGIQAELLPQLTAQPASAPLTGAAQGHLRELDAHNAWIIGQLRIGYLFIRGERHLLRSLIILAEEIDRFAQDRLLNAIDLAQIKHMPLDDSAAGQATIFDKAPVAVRLAIFKPF